MDVTKIFAILCGFLLIICLTLSITCLVVMRNAVDETSAWQNRAEALVNELDGCVQAIKEIETEDLAVIAPDNGENNLESIHYCLRLEKNHLGIFDGDGYLIKTLEINPILLPEKEREKLAEGICVDSWAKMQKSIQDYE